MSKQFWLVVAVIIVVLVGIFVLTGKNNNPTSSTGSSKPTEHIEGQGKAGVTLVEYGDYQCPYCGEYYSTIKQVVSEYNSEITFQFRNFPLTSIHQNAFAGARAAEAAGLMGEFWQMHDLLYTQNQEYYNTNGAIAGWIGASDPETVFASDAVSLGLNKQQFEKDYSSDKVNNLINADVSVGNSLNIDATPTFFLDGKAITENNTVQAFEKVISAEIVKKTGHQPTLSSAGSATAGSSTTK